MLFVTAVCDDLANTKTADRQPELRIITKCIVQVLGICTTMRGCIKDTDNRLYSINGRVGL